nr:hypothetical protein [uncultured Methanobrevibacter sp.]
MTIASTAMIYHVPEDGSCFEIDSTDADTVQKQHHLHCGSAAHSIPEALLDVRFPLSVQ